MTRTVRRLPIGRHNTLKWYRNRFEPGEENILKRPCPPDQVDGHYEVRIVPCEKRVETFITNIPMPPYCIPGSHEWPNGVYPMLWDRWYRKYGPKLNQYDGWDTVGPSGHRWSGSNHTHTQILAYRYVPSTRKVREWVRNPDYDWEQSCERSRWFSVHEEIYRNGSCRRQRINGVRKTKQQHHRVERRRGRAALHGLLREYWLGDLG